MTWVWPLLPTRLSSKRSWRGWSRGTASQCPEIRGREAEPPPAQDPAIAKQDAEALTHLHRAARLNPNHFHPRDAEPEFGEAAAADPRECLCFMAGGEILGGLGKSDAELA